MKYTNKTKEQLIEELTQCRQKIKSLQTKVYKQTKSLESVNKFPQNKIRNLKKTESKLKESEKRFKTLFEFAPDAYYLIDLRGTIIDGNRAAEKLIGYKKNEVLGKNILRFKILAPNEVTRALPLLAKSAREIGTGPDEFTIITKKGTKKTVEILTHPVKIKNRIVVLGIARDITQRKIAEQKLQESQEKLKHIFNSVDHGIFSIDLNGIYTQVNQRLAEMYGHDSPEDMIGKNCFDFFTPGNKRAAQMRMKQIVEKDNIDRQEYTALRSDGTEFLLEISAFLMKDQQGFPTGISGRAKDITEQKKAEKALQLSEKKYRSLVENINDVIFNTNEKGEITFISSKIKDISGYSPDEVINHPFIEFIHPDDREKILQEFSEIKTGIMEPSEYRITTKTGGYVWVHSSSRPQLAEKEFKGITGIITDITDRKQAEMAQIKEKQKAQQYLDVANVIIVALNKKGEVTLINQKGCQILGYKEREIIGKKWFTHFIPDRLRKKIEPVAKQLMQGKVKDKEYYENPILTKSGQERLIAWRNTLLQDEEGLIIGTLSSGEDITDRKQAEKMAAANYIISKAINETTNLDRLYPEIHNIIRNFINVTNFFIALYDRKKDIIRFPYFTDEYDDDLIIKNASKSGSLTAEVINTKKPIVLKENQLKERYKKSKKGWGTQPKIWIGIPLKVKEEIIGVIAIQSYTDPNLYTEHDLEILKSISGAIAFAIQRKSSFDEIEKRQKFLESVLDSTPDAMITLNPDHNIVDWNPGAEWMFGYARKEAIGKNLDDLITQPEVRNEAEAITLEAISGKKVLPREAVRFRKDGSPINVIVSGSPIIIGKELIGILAVYTDITQIKKTEEALRQSEAKYSAVVENSKDGIVIIQNRKLIFANLAAAQLLGFAPEFMIGSDFMKFIAPADQQMAAKRYIDRLAGKKVPNIYELTLLKKDGSELKAEINATLIQIDNTTADLIFVRDITDRKKAEQALRESETRFRSLYENSVLGLYRTTPEGNIIMANPALVRMLGYDSFEGLSRRNLEEGGYESDYPREKFKKQIEKNGKVIGLRSAWRKKDGTQLYISESASAIYDKSGKILYYDGTVEDITKRIKAENALRDSEERFRLAANIATDLIYEWDISSDELIWYGGIERALGHPKNSIPRTIAGWINIIHPEDQKRLKDAVKHHRTSTQPILEEYRVQHKDGTWRNWIDKGIPILNERSMPIKWIGSCIDVTEAKKAEQALQESEKNYRSVIEASNDGIYLLYNRKFEIVNKKFEQMMNITQKELNRPDFDVMDLVAPKSRPMVEDRLKRANLGEKLDPTYEFTALTKDKKEVEIETTVSYVKYKEGVGILGIFRNISERKRMENYIEQITDLKAKLLGPLNLDDKLKLITDGMVDIFDFDFARIWLIQPGDLCDKGCFHATKTKGPHVCRFRNKCLHLKVSSGRFTHTNGKIHKRVPFGCYKIGRIASGRDNWFLTNDVPNDKRVHDNLWAKKLGLVSFAGYRLLSGTKEPIGVLAFFSKHKISPAIDDLIQGIANTTTQVIQNSIAEESLRVSQQRFSSIFNSAGDGIMYLNKTGKILEVNPSLLRLTGIPRDELINKSALTIARKFLKPKIAVRFLLKIKDTLQGKPLSPYEIEYRDKILEISAPILKGSSGITGIIHDVTERKQTLQRIQQSLEEKEVLLQEIHHRVKNNLMIIIGLLNYYSMNIDDENIHKIFSNLQNTIHSMALIHEKLYQQEDIAKINFVHYVNDLIDHLLGIHSQYMGRITFHIEIDNILLNLRTAIPCGMIISELVSNTLKHAFPEIQSNKNAYGKRKKPHKYTIKIMINKGKMLTNGKIRTSPKGWFHLKIRDNGIGLPKNLNLKNSHTLGLRLVKLMVEQLEGQMRMESENGACFNINFREQ